jgi:D-sedoheptulose 7-phosphate isomerase
MHFAEECTGRFHKDRPALPVIPLMEAGHMTCVSNDYGFEHVFARGVEAYGRPGDILIGITTSGNSPNVIRASEIARKAGLKVLLFLGKDGGALRGFGDGEIWVRHGTTERVQEVHMTVLHILVESIERQLFPENYPVE